MKIMIHNESVIDKSKLLKSIYKLESWKRMISIQQEISKSVLIGSETEKIEFLEYGKTIDLSWSNIIAIINILLKMLYKAQEIFGDKYGNIKKPGFLGFRMWIPAGKLLLAVVKEIIDFTGDEKE